MDNMMHAITPSKQKMEKHGVQSVRQRITLLKDHTDMPLDDIKHFLRKNLCSTVQELNEDDMHNIRKIEEEYDDPAFIFSKNPTH